jgi:hypothetical protein
VPGRTGFLRLDTNVSRPFLICDVAPNGTVCGWVFGAPGDSLTAAVRVDPGGQFKAIAPFNLIQAVEIQQGAAIGQWLPGAWL